jgi:hypothetical protein
MAGKIAEEYNNSILTGIIPEVWLYSYMIPPSETSRGQVEAGRTPYHNHAKHLRQTH